MNDYPIGVFSFLLIQFFLLVVLPIWTFMKITKKAGYPPWRRSLMLLPGINFLNLVGLAFSQWPIEERLEELLKDNQRLRELQKSSDLENTTASDISQGT